MSHIFVLETFKHGLIKTNGLIEKNALLNQAINFNLQMNESLGIGKNKMQEILEL